jgi:hypothetical protein
VTADRGGQGWHAAEDLHREAVPVKQFHQGRHRIVGDTERTGRKSRPRRIRRTDEKVAARAQDPGRLAHEAVRPPQIVQSFEQDDHVEAAVPKGQGLRIEAQKRDPTTVMIPGYLDQILHVVAADHAPRVLRQIAKPETRATRDFKNIPTLSISTGDRISMPYPR